MGQQIIQTIKNRTLDGRNIDGSAFAPYSQRYTDSLEFRLAGKQPSRVDLRFTREMINALEVDATSQGSVTISFSTTEAASKAEWAEASDNGPSRKFFGASDSELSAILSQFPAPENLPQSLGLDILQAILRRSG